MAAGQTHDFAAALGDLVAAAHQRLDRAGVDRYSSPVPWHIARTTTLTRRPRPPRPHPKEQTHVHRPAC